MNPYIPGTIFTGPTEYTVVCFLCKAEAVDHQWSKSRAVRQFKSSGWALIRKRWICPAHTWREAWDATKDEAARA